MFRRLRTLRRRWASLHARLADLESSAAWINLRVGALESGESGETGAEQRARSLLDLLSPQPSSHDFHRVGPPSDGGYIIAADLPNPDVVISIGIGTEDRADRELADRGLPVHQFDHTIESSPSGGYPGITFHRLGIGGAAAAPPLLPLHELERRAGGLSDGWLFCDVEGWEWEVLLDGSSDLGRYSQICIEMHGLLAVVDPEASTVLSKGIRRLIEHHVVVASHPNNFGGFFSIGRVRVPNVVELTLVRRDRFRSGFELPPHSMFTPNTSTKEDVPFAALVQPWSNELVRHLVRTHLPRTDA